jgi:hypothetical protein
MQSVSKSSFHERYTVQERDITSEVSFDRSYV